MKIQPSPIKVLKMQSGYPRGNRIITEIGICICRAGIHVSDWPRVRQIGSAFGSCGTASNKLNRAVGFINCREPRIAYSISKGMMMRCEKENGIPYCSRKVILNLQFMIARIGIWMPESRCVC